MKGVCLSIGMNRLGPSDTQQQKVSALTVTTLGCGRNVAMMKATIPMTLAILLAGCAAPYSEPALSADHPAAPAAASAPMPERSRTLDLDLAEPVTARPASRHEHGTETGTGHDDTPVAPDVPAGDAPIYTCPMHPDVTSTEPGRCPECNMKLVPEQAEGADR